MSPRVKCQKMKCHRIKCHLGWNVKLPLGLGGWKGLMFSFLKVCYFQVRPNTNHQSLRLLRLLEATVLYFYNKNAAANFSLIQFPSKLVSLGFTDTYDLVFWQISIFLECSSMSASLFMGFRVNRFFGKMLCLKTPKSSFKK